MELALSILTLVYADLHFNGVEMLNAAIKRILRVLLFLLGCLVVPVTRLRAFFDHRRRCPPIRNKILLMTATELAEKIRKGEITSEQVVSSYIERCREVNPVINAIVEDRFEAALREARQVDSFVKSGGKSEEALARDTPLLGIPVTVKESIAVTGMSHCVGRKREVSRKAIEDAEVVAKVRQAGCIVLLVSNTPEMCMCWESYNNVTGTTRNPYDSRRTAGGSSGGEAALLGAGASLLSLSSDIGGSARLPAMFCGVFGHKPTPEWVSTTGHMPGCTDKNWSSFFSIGPMVRYAQDLPILLKTIGQSDAPISRLGEVVPMSEVRFFYMEDDGGSGATSPVDREIKDSIRKVIAHLETYHAAKVQRADIKELRYAFEIGASMLLRLDGADSIFKKGTDPCEWKSVFVECLRYICLVSPHTFPNIVYGVLKRISDKLPVSHYDRMVEKNNLLKTRFQDILGDNGVLIYPSFIGPAHYPYEIFHKVCNVSYMMIFNALGLPVTQCPVGLNRNGLPIGVQIVGNPGSDHLTIAVAQEIERAFGGWHQPPSHEKII
ncbi:fatty-acid amide hydrolase 2-B isoform X2 [Venturia canescens]|nr:fatty-acid amide hydrolase 2-B isoform X2 [Venturia canescens]